MNSLDEFKRYVAQTSPYPIGIPIQKAEGTLLHGEEGIFVDMTSGVGVMSLGHSNSVIVKSIVSQAQRYLHTMVEGEHLHEPTTLYAHALSQYFESALGYDTAQVFFVNSGNESVDLALKMARKITGRKGLVALKKGFHGRGYGAMQATWNEEYKKNFFVDDEETDWIDFSDDLSTVDWKSKAAVIVEYVQGEAGARKVPLPFLKKLRELCTEHGVMLIADEVQTGYGRLGSITAQEKYGVVADITCLGKAGGGGLPFGAVVASREKFEKLQTPPLSHISTFGGNPVVCAAGLAAFSQLTEVLLDAVREKSEFIRNRIDELSQMYPKVISHWSGDGLLLGLHLADSSLTEKFFNLCKERGVLFHFKLNAGATLRVSPPLTIDLETLEDVFDVVEEVAQEMQSDS